VEDCVKAIADRETACVHKFKKFPRPEGIYSGPAQYQLTAATKLSALGNYLKIAKYLLPKDKSSHAAVLWHGDSHANNIFVVPKNLTKILSIIDWQCTKIDPLFLQARRQVLISVEGPIPQANQIPLPKNFDILSADEQKSAKDLRSSQLLYKWYGVACQKYNRAAHNAVLQGDTIGVEII